MYESYALNSAIYSIALLIGGFILAFGLAKDERIYALAVSFVINLGVIYVSACTKKAPAIRGNLMRLYEGGRRSQLIQTKRQR
jgi:hypothetical protein